MTPEVFDRWYEASRTGSGVPPTVEDEATLTKLARLLRGTDPTDPNGGGPGMVARRRRRERSSTTAEQAAKQAGRSDASS